MRVPVLALALLVTICASALAEEARWLRYPAISPDGERIVFSYKGDLWIVAAKGGPARPLTTHTATERMPVWSNDGRQIAFASDRHGNFDVFVMSGEGGPATRLTFHSNDDLPSGFTADGDAVIFTSRRLDDPGAVLPTPWMPELYSVPTTGGRPRQLLTTPAFGARMSRDGGSLVYEDLRGFENQWRKHHTSSVARDIRVVDLATGAHRKLTDHVAEDRDPVWSPDGAAVFFLSERGGTLNVWKTSAAGGACEPMTHHRLHPVRFLSISDAGTLCYAQGGDLYTLAPGGNPKRVPVEALADDRDNPVVRSVVEDGATEIALSPEEDEIAFIVRGEVFVTSVEHGTTRRVTATPEQERTVSWAPDGRALYYAGERGGSWNLYKAALAKADEDHFFNATVLTEEPVLVTPAETFQPSVSPDGKLLVYLHERDEIRVLDLASGQSKTLVPAARNYSYSDGDVSYAWSPDSRWLTFTWIPRNRWIDDVGVAEVETGRVTNISESGYSSFHPHWGTDGRSLLFLSNRFGRRSHGSWGGENDVLAFVLNQAAFDRARLSSEDFALLLAKEKKDKEQAKKAKNDGPDGDGEKDGDEEKKAPKPLDVDLGEGTSDPIAAIDHRTRRLTLVSAPIGDHRLSKDGEVLLYTAQVDDAWGLWMCRMRAGETKKLLDLGASRPGELELTKDGKTLFVRDGKGRIKKIELGGSIAKDGGGQPKSKPVGFAAELTVDAQAERAHLFEHVWRQAQKKFYDPDLHGVNWAGIKDHYRANLVHVSNGHDFAELLSEMLGELNASHTGARHRPKIENADTTAALGLLFAVTRTDADANGPLVVAEVLTRGPCDRADSKIAPGVAITHIDGQPVAGRPLATFLNHRTGKATRLSLRLADGTDAEEVIKPIGLREQANLLHERWVEGRRRFVEEASEGRVGYVHIRGMNDRSFRRFYSEVLGRNSDKEALIVDTRFNGGGWLHDDLVRFFESQDYLWFVPRGKQKGALGAEPFARWTRPSCVVVSEGNYSDAHMFPAAYQIRKLGKVVGAPVPGTATAVWWETLIDPTIVFGIPQVGMMTVDGRYLENTQLEPDVLVLNEPGDMARGRDPQLLKAVEVLLQELR